MESTQRGGGDTRCLCIHTFIQQHLHPLIVVAKKGLLTLTGDITDTKWPSFLSTELDFRWNIVMIYIYIN